MFQILKTKTKVLRPKILLGLTTTPGSDWRAKIDEIDELGIEELALFPTCLSPKKRPELYALLEKTGLKRIPHVHIRGDFDMKEIEYLIERYQAEVFNIHPDLRGLEVLKDASMYKDRIYLENLEDNIDDIAANVDKCGGICLDISHWEAAKRDGNAKSYDKFPDLLQKNKIGCSHISTVLDEARLFDWGEGLKPYYAWHYMEDIKYLKYVEKYLEYLLDLISIELENSFEEQLKVKEYIEKLISSK